MRVRAAPVLRTAIPSMMVFMKSSRLPAVVEWRIYCCKLVRNMKALELLVSCLVETTYDLF
uniref:Uncharacterized protein n=1 Tax=Candidatus Kentrum eta TaxID=2126337 RepID=A0A450V3Z6_9GAMM|nr:MAG: hypothetical protein BECKH772B_GA0070898_101605 [Candidatus Kentron sp. H]VFK00086.1 MAG: hypothetical protein BECKH772A_GA0070896_101815 [Candidatus Kentron sp. H]VFK04406.1 MAG: hypothetical protein BECKH772C_GA0070978_101795 [Candidatus Kentron sp. H]